MPFDPYRDHLKPMTPEDQRMFLTVAMMDIQREIDAIYLGNQPINQSRLREIRVTLREVEELFRKCGIRVDW